MVTKNKQKNTVKKQKKQRQPTHTESQLCIDFCMLGGRINL